LFAYLSIIGFVQIPIIKKSVDWWSSLHQPASITLTEKPAIDVVMLYPLFMAIIGFSGLIACLVILSSKVQIYKREKTKNWIKNYV
jgi:heme exporter protein C